MPEFWNSLPSWLRWSSVTAVAGGFILLANLVGAAPVLEPYAPATRGYVVYRVELADNTTVGKLNDVRAKLLNEQIKAGVRYRRDLSIQALDLKDRLDAMEPTDPNRKMVRDILLDVQTGIDTSEKDERSAECELGTMFGAAFHCASP